jgi:hypothetical protein
MGEAGRRQSKRARLEWFDGEETFQRSSQTQIGGEKEFAAAKNAR